MSDPMDNFPVGRVGESRIVSPDRPSMDVSEMARLFEAVVQRKDSIKGEAALSERVHVPVSKVNDAISFWKPVYFDRTIEGRQINGIEAYEMGDPEKTDGTACDQGPYIAMCNLMALEAIKMMGDQMPTAHKGVMLPYASEREQEIAKFWKETFAPTEFQCDWAWTACLGVLSGSQVATLEILDKYRDQLP